MKDFISHEEYGESIREMLTNESVLNIAVSYWSNGILDELGIDNLIKNSEFTATRIICDLADDACHYEPIEKLIRSNIEIKSIRGLHAKVWSSKKFAILGSANASRAALHFSVGSNRRNIEAGIRITNPSTIKSINNWFEVLWECDQCKKITHYDIQQEKRKPRNKNIPVPVYPEMVETLFPSRSVILEEVKSWKTDSLINGKSLFSKRPLWTLRSFEELKEKMSNIPRQIDFVNFVSTVLSNASTESCKLMAEVYWIFCLIHQVAPESKLRSLNQIWDMSGDQALPDEHEKFDLLRRERGFVSKGQSLSQKPAAIKFLTLLMCEIFKQPKESRQKLINSYFDFAQLADEVYGRQKSQAKHIILFLMFPNLFPSIINTDHKRLIATFEPFRKYLGVSELSRTPSSFEIELRLNAIRYNLEREVNASIDFYGDSCFNGWRNETR